MSAIISSLGHDMGAYMVVANHVQHGSHRSTLPLITKTIMFVGSYSKAL